MSKTIIEKVTIALILVSAILGVLILALDTVLEDRYLLEFASINAPVSHAYALVVFIIVDVIVAAIIVSKPLTGMLVAFVWGILQFLAMALDPITAPLYNTPGFGVNEFTVYLFSLPEFDARLVVQVAVVILSLRGYLLLKRLSVK